MKRLPLVIVAGMTLDCRKGKCAPTREVLAVSRAGSRHDVEKARDDAPLIFPLE